MNTLMLISIVEAIPALYDKFHTDYYKEEVIRFIWSCIGHEFSMEGSELREQWGKLRGLHKHAIIRAQDVLDGVLTEEKDGFQYLKEMEFLKPFYRGPLESETSALTTDSESYTEDEDSY